MTLFHGTANGSFSPVFGGGRDYHDYGNGFYCTDEFDLAAEWACQSDVNRIAYVYEYEIETEALSILDLTKLDAAYWVSILMRNRFDRKERNLLSERRRQFTEKYSVETSGCDIIKGWRANDKYFAYVRDFLNVAISYETLQKAVLAGNLGLQYVIISKRAYNKLRFVRRHILEEELYADYSASYHARDEKARSDYDNEARFSSENGGTTILEML